MRVYLLPHSQATFLVDLVATNIPSLPQPEQMPTVMQYAVAAVAIIVSTLIAVNAFRSRPLEGVSTSQPVNFNEYQQLVLSAQRTTASELERLNVNMEHMNGHLDDIKSLLGQVRIDTGILRGLPPR